MAYLCNLSSLESVSVDLLPHLNRVLKHVHSGIYSPSVHAREHASSRTLPSTVTSKLLTKTLRKQVHRMCIINTGNKKQNRIMVSNNIQDIKNIVTHIKIK